jgi:adenosine deaminase
MSLAPRVEVKVGPYFDILEAAMAEENIELAETMLARISSYFHLLDDEHKDYYHGCQYAIEENLVHTFADGYVEDEYDEPTEYDEWQSFDSDC